jgi:hypothetical protein
MDWHVGFFPREIGRRRQSHAPLDRNGLDDAVEFVESTSSVQGDKPLGAGNPPRAVGSVSQPALHRMCMPIFSGISA